MQPRPLSPLHLPSHLLLTKHFLIRQYSSTLKITRPFPILDPKAFNKDQPTPGIFPQQHFLCKLPAFANWFTGPSTLNTDYLLSFKEDPLLPVEITQYTKDNFPSTQASGNCSNSGNNVASFTQSELPFSVLLAYLTTPEAKLSKLPHIYLAQTPPPKFLEKDLPTPFAELGYTVRSANNNGRILRYGKSSALDSSSSSDKGTNDRLIDIYASSLWLGLAHTSRTPLHRDPNSNIFIQLAGHKQIRCFPPTFGEKLFGRGQQRIRGADMMVGEGKERIDEIVWGDDGILEREGGFEVRVGRGDGVFIKEGWWHAVRGVVHGENAGNGRRGVVASVNWWFR